MAEPTQSGCRGGDMLLTVLPREIFRMIAENCARDRVALARLALLSPECRQVARAYQFENLRLDLGERSCQLLDFLLHEATTRDNYAGAARRAPGIGDYVRRIEVAVVYISLRPEFSPARLYPLPFEDLQDIGERYEVFVAQLAFLLRPGALPNLEHLDTGARFWFPGSAVIRRALHSDSIRHLYLRASTHQESLRAAVSHPVSTVSQFLPRAPKVLSSPFFPGANSHSDNHRPPEAVIETLELDLMCHSCSHHPQWDMTVFLSDVLNRCAPSLRTLRLRSLYSDNRGLSIERSDDMSMPHLPLLDFLYVDRKAHLGMSFLAPLLDSSPALRTLVVDPSYPGVAEILRPRRLDSVRNVIWCCDRVKEQLPSLDPGALLAPFSRIEGFCITSAGLLDEPSSVACLLPLLAPLACGSRFCSLARLSLAFGNETVPEAAIEHIGRIVTLESLHLSAQTEEDSSDRPALRATGARAAPRPASWLVKHNVVRRHLAGLQRLKLLYFDGDDYLLPPIAAEARHSHQLYYQLYEPLSRFPAVHVRSAARTPRLVISRKSQRLGFTYRRLSQAVSDPDSLYNRQWESYRDAAARWRGPPPPQTAPWYWEGYARKGHSRRMVSEAERYAALFPRLRDVMLGDLHHVIERKSDGDDGSESDLRDSDVRISGDKPLDPLKELFGFTADTCTVLEDDSPLGISRYPNKASKMYPPLRAASDGGDDDEQDDGDQATDQGDANQSARNHGEITRPRTRRGIRHPVDVPLRQFFCESCFILARRADPCGSAVGSTLQTECAHYAAMPSAAYMAVEAAGHAGPHDGQQIRPGVHWGDYDGAMETIFPMPL